MRKLRLSILFACSINQLPAGRIIREFLSELACIDHGLSLLTVLQVEGSQGIQVIIVLRFLFESLNQIPFCR